jgi:hypothetical protein
MVTADIGYPSAREAPPGAVVIGMTAPRITNGEAVQLITAFHSAARDAFALWAQYAAVAYGWDPPDNDELDASVGRAARAYAADLTVALWLELRRLTQLLDARMLSGQSANDDGARLDLGGQFSDPAFVASVREHLQSDGADALFKIPTPFCTDKRTGERRWPRPPCGKDGKLRDPFTGADIACDKPGDCDALLLDDPITAVVKSLLPLALVVGALWLITRPTDKPRRSRRYRN